MADFKTHITTSSILGCIYGAGGFYIYDQPLPHSLVAAGLCSVAGMLPDLDSNSGIPQREMLSFVSVVIPMLMLKRFEALGLNAEHMVFIAGVMYVTIRFGIGGLFRRFTKHRGMWHSVPAALVAGMVTFMICLTPEFESRLFKSWAVVLGFVSHLVLDEIYAVNWEGKLPKTKKSFGTALKFWGKDQMPNLFVYGNFALLVVMILGDDYMMSCLCDQPVAEAPESPLELFKSLFNHNHVGDGGSTETIHR